MKFEWAELAPGRYSAVVGDWTLVAWTAAHDNAHRGAVQLEGVEVLRARFASLDEAKAVAERWVREYVAPFVEAAVAAERAACAKIAGDIAENNLTALNRLFDPSNATVRVVEARIETANGIAQAIRARRDGAR
jgi:hypothetical protein